MSRAKTKLSDLDHCRVDELVAIILDGAEPRWDIPHYVSEKQAAKEPLWEEPLTGKELAALIGHAEKQIAASCKTPATKLLNRHLAQRRNLYAKAVSQGDVRSALACLRDEAQLQGLYERKPPKRGKVPALGAQATAADVQELLAAVQMQLLRGEIDPRTVQSIMQLAAVQMKLQQEGQQAADDARLLEANVELSSTEPAEADEVLQ